MCVYRLYRNPYFDIIINLTVIIILTYREQIIELTLGLTPVSTHVSLERSLLMFKRQRITQPAVYTTKHKVIRKYGSLPPIYLSSTLYIEQWCSTCRIGYLHGWEFWWLQDCNVLLTLFTYRIAENFRGRKLSCFGTKREFCGENFRGLLQSNYYVGVTTKLCEENFHRWF